MVGSDAKVELRAVRAAGAVRATPRVADVGLRFGVSACQGPVTILDRTVIPFRPGGIILLTGPSGSGKSTALGEIARRFPGGVSVGRMTFPSDLAIVDRVAPGASLGEALATLTACGLGEAGLWIRPFASLSDGEKFRARLARAVALMSRGGAVGPLLCDEFCSTLHRRSAKAISFNLSKLAARRNLTIVLACPHEDVIDDLQPRVIVRFHGGGRCTVEQREVRPRRAVSFRRRLRIHEGRKADYDAFAAMHYRATDELGFVDKVFVLREGDEPLGIVVYSHGPLELALRNRATRGWFSRRPDRVNRSLRILRRLVIHPDLRGCGIGHELVRKTMPHIGTAYVECLAGMGEFNPVFERAGMERVGQYDVAPKARAALEALRTMGVDPAAHDFLLHVSRRRGVRMIVSGVVEGWYAATTAGAERRVDHQSPEFLAQAFRGLIGSRPVYYLWRRKRGRAA